MTVCPSVGLVNYKISRQEMFFFVSELLRLFIVNKQLVGKSWSQKQQSMWISGQLSFNSSHG